MSDSIGIRGQIEGDAAVLREHATEREYPFVLEEGDILHIGNGEHIRFTARHVFHSREHQDQFVDEWRDSGS